MVEDIDEWCIPGYVADNLDCTYAGFNYYNIGIKTCRRLKILVNPIGGKAGCLELPLILRILSNNAG
jgi:hypothetical protein